ncbi:50S ribosomal protein L13 [Candidatus Gracilibacteria bacterium]|nr:50S ribosomal protein L13 [Candidatus Gracilibacteria bacterium]
MKTLVAKQLPGNERKWFVVDAQGMNLGRLSTSIARLLSGRDQVDFTPHIDNGAYVIVTNINAISVTGKKEAVKMYRSHSQYLGGLKETTLGDMRKKNPAHILRHAVTGMLPKNKLQSAMIERLKLVDGVAHQYEAQKPQTITLA